jgi:uncharacterized phage protein (predicted DNA packaging)
MQYLILDDIRKHIRIDLDEEDEILERYGEAAEQTILNACNRTFEDLIEAEGKVPAPLYQATLMLTAHLYEQRSIVSPTQMYAVPYTIDPLIKPYMIL